MPICRMLGIVFYLKAGLFCSTVDSAQFFTRIIPSIVLTAIASPIKVSPAGLSGDMTFICRKRDVAAPVRVIMPPAILTKV